MTIKYDRQTQFDMIQILKALDIKDEICQRYTRCDECPLDRLRPFDSRTCDEISKLSKRLALAYKIVEAL